MRFCPATLAACALALLLAACGASDRGGAPAGAPPPGAARAVVDLAGARLGLSAQVWVNRMPGPSSPVDRPLGVAVQVAAPEGLPDGVAIDRLWVRAGEHGWESALDYLVKSDGALKGGASGGPDLEGEGPVTVTVRVTAPDGVRYLETQVPGALPVF